MNVTTIFLVFLGIGALLMCEGRKYGSRRKIPIKGDRNGRKSRRSTECRMGRERYELEQVWHPDLGPPFGVMYCIRCECMAIKRKRRIKGKTRCRNVRNECPKPTCDEPVLLPEQCCKTCPGPSESMAAQDMAIPYDISDENGKSRQFMALLVGSGSPYTASGRFLYKRRSLYYTVLYAGMKQPPVAIRFLRPDGDILEEQKVLPANAKDSRLCGIWNRVPRIYRSLVKEERLIVSLVPAGNMSSPLSGRLTRNTALATELFVGTLTPSPSVLGGGGSVVVSVSTSTGGIHLSILFAGLIPASEVSDIPIAVIMTRKDDPQPIVDVTMRVPKPLPEFNTLEVKSTLNSADMRTLARGRMMITVQVKDVPEASVSGWLSPSSVCSIFSAVMTGDSPGSAAAGYTIVNVGTDGALTYDVAVRRLEGPLQSLAFEEVSKRKRKVIHDMLPDFEGTGESGRAKGVYNKVNTRELESLVDGDLHIWMGEGLEGRLQGRLYGPAQMSSMEPYFLTCAQPHPAAALVWIAVEDDCTINYDVEVSGFSPDILLHLELLEEPQPALFPTNRVILRKFSGPRIEGSYIEVEDTSLARLQSGQTSLVVAGDNLEVRAQIRQMWIPSDCLPTLPPVDPGFSPEFQIKDQGIRREPVSLKCVQHDKVYDDGQHWTSHRDHCTLCTCLRGKISCDRQICPPITCEKTVLLPGECCPACMDATQENSTHTLERGRCLFDDGTEHAAGTSWHPYLPTFGFSRCAVCTCHSENLTTTCVQVRCPELNCSKSDAVRDSPDACCKRCAPHLATVDEDKPHKHEAGSQGDQGSEKTAQDILAEGGCRFKARVYHNGAEWHPRVQPYGVMKCVTCTCKDGKGNCRRQRCPRVKCQKGETKEKRGCCSVCVERRKRRKFA